MGNHRVHLVAVADGALQLYVLLHNDTLGSHERNLVHHSHDKLFLVERLGEEVVGSHLETMDKVGRRIQGSKEDDWYISRFRILLQLYSCIKTTDIGHHHIKQYKVRMLFLAYLQTSCTVVCRENLEFLICQQNLEQQHVTHYVVNHQYAIVTPVDTRFKSFSVFHILHQFNCCYFA